MHSTRYRFDFACLRRTSALLAALLIPCSASAAPLDTPALTVLETGQAVVHLEVQAGASGAPTGFQIQWISRDDYDMLGGWPADPLNPALRTAQFRGTPTLNTSDGTSSFLLAPGQAARIQIGDLFDETGVGTSHRSELTPDSDYLFRVIARPTADAEESAPSGNLGGKTRPSGNANCTYTQGYWKNHASAWPVQTLIIGTVSYTKAQLLQIFGQPAQGNGLVSLAHQLIAAKLNVAAGASLPGAVLTAIQNADAAIAGNVAPPIGAGWLAPGSTSALTQTLDDYNNGISGPGHCGAVPVQSSTWGNLKLLYR